MKTIINDVYQDALTSFGKNFKQDPDEIKEAMEFVVSHFQALGRKELTFVEIGVCMGGNFSFMGNVLACFFKTEGIGVELPNQPQWGGGEVDVNQILQNIPPHFPYTMIIGNSQDAGTVDLLKKYLQGKTIDFLFIDGDHSLKGCKIDFDRYRPLVAADGITALHDIIEYPPWPHVEVYKLWNIIKQIHYTIEFSHQNRFGIGMVIPGQK